MAGSPHMQQMMLGMLPSALRRPEVLQQMFSDPDTKKKIAEMIAKRVRGTNMRPLGRRPWRRRSMPTNSADMAPYSAVAQAVSSRCDFSLPLSPSRPQGMPLPDTLLDRMTPASMESTFSSAQRMGLDPGKVLSRLMGHPGLVAKLQDPRVMQVGRGG